MTWYSHVVKFFKIKKKINTELPNVFEEMIWVLTTYCLWGDSRIYLLYTTWGVVLWGGPLILAIFTSSCVLDTQDSTVMFFYPTDLPIRDRESMSWWLLSAQILKGVISPIFFAGNHKGSTRAHCLPTLSNCSLTSRHSEEIFICDWRKPNTPAGSSWCCCGMAWGISGAWEYNRPH